MAACLVALAVKARSRTTPLLRLAILLEAVEEDLAALVDLVVVEACSSDGTVEAIRVRRRNRCRKKLSLERRKSLSLRNTRCAISVMAAALKGMVAWKCA